MKRRIIEFRMTALDGVGRTGSPEGVVSTSHEWRTTMPYHPHATFRDFLRDYLLMIDPMMHPVTMEPMYPSEAIHRAANSPWRLCVPMRDDDWMQIAVPSPVDDHGLEPILGPAVRAVLERRCTVQDAETMVRTDPWDGMIMVPSRSHDDEHRIDALETASRIYAMGLAATGMIE